MPTIEQFIDECMIAVNNHTPYVYGGTSLTKGCDCSGMIYAACLNLGISIARTSQGQYNTLPRSNAGGRGKLILFYVPSDGTAPGDQPGHVAVDLGNGTMIQEPHTGLDAEISIIPNVPSEQIMAYCSIPQLTAAPPPAPPKPPVDLMELFTMNCQDPTTGGTWIVNPQDGAVESLFGAPAAFGGLNEPTPNRDNWQGVGYISGITPWEDPGGTGWGYAIIVKHNVVIPGTGAWYSPYTFRRNGADK